MEWLGQIPEHWQVLKLRRITLARCDGPFGSGLKSMHYRNDGVRVIRLQNIRFAAFDGTDEAFIDPEYYRELGGHDVQPGDLLIAGLGDDRNPVGRACVAPPAICPAMVKADCFRFRIDQRLATSEYFAYQLSTTAAALNGALATGTTRSRMNLSETADRSVLLPPHEEQKAIAAFLDRETARIDGLIAKKQRQIELLGEKRAALISHTVTSGLDPNIRMKDSGIEWLGQIPEHWQIKRLKFVSDLQTGLTLGKKHGGRELATCPYLRVANVQDGYLDLETITEVQIPPEDVKRYELQPGDVLMTEGGDFDKLGRGYVWEGQIAGCLHQNHIFAVRPKQNELDSDFLAAVLTSSHGKNYFTSTSQQTTNLATTNSTKLRSFPVPLPPPDEQKAILCQVKTDTEHLDNLKTKIDLSIVRLREYRTALISAAVTGKIDVREEVAS